MAELVPFAEVIRDRLLAFSPAANDGTLATRLGSRIYLRRPPNNTAWPYCAMRIQNESEGGDDGGHRTQGEVELRFFARNLTDYAHIQRDAAIAREAFTRWNYSDPNAAGVLTMRPGASIQDIDATESPADAELFVVRAVFPFTAWPATLPEYTPSA